MHRRNFLQVTGAATLASYLSKPLMALPADNRYLKNIGLQLWTVRNQIEKDAKSALKAVADAGYHQVELMKVLGSEELVKIAKDNGLQIKSSFMNWEVLAKPGEDGVPTFAEVLDGAQALELDHLVFGYIGKGYRETPDQLKKIAERCNNAGRKCHEAGMQLGYHNHSFEFEKLDNGETGFDVFMKEFDPGLTKFELDVFWAQIGGWDPVETMHKLKGRISQLHLKDLKQGTETCFDESKVPVEAFKELGAGVVDLKKVLAVAEEIGVDQCHVEQDQSPNPINSIGQSRSYLSGL